MAWLKTNQKQYQNQQKRIDEYMDYKMEKAMKSHKESSVLDHPDASVTDEKIGIRTVVDSSTDSGDFTGLFSAIINNIANAIRSIRASFNTHKSNNYIHITDEERSTWNNTDAALEEEIEKIKTGKVIVGWAGEASFANTAEFSNRARQDADGNDIHATYAKKTEVGNITELKTTEKANLVSAVNEANQTANNLSFGVGEAYRIAEEAQTAIAEFEAGTRIVSVAGHANHVSLADAASNDESGNNICETYATKEELRNVSAFASDALDIARGANQAISFDNYEEMVNFFNTILEWFEYNRGQNIMIVTLEVPDLWISDIKDDLMLYEYTTDENMVAELKSNGSIQVGHFVLSMLETQKVDLTEYPTKVELEDGLFVPDYANNATFAQQATYAERDKEGNDITTTYATQKGVAERFQYYGNANAIVGQASGKTITLTDVSPVSHNVDIAVSNIVGNKKKDFTTLFETEQSENGITIRDASTSEYKAFHISGTMSSLESCSFTSDYTIAGKTDKQGAILIEVIDGVASPGLYFSLYDAYSFAPPLASVKVESTSFTGTTMSFVYPTNPLLSLLKMNVSLYGDSGDFGVEPEEYDINIDCVIKYQLLEPGTDVTVTATDGNGAATTYTPENDATLSIPSISPYMHFTTNCVDVVMNVQYLRDTNELVKELTETTGDIETALDNIISIQNTLIGGDSE